MRDAIGNLFVEGQNNKHLKGAVDERPQPNAPVGYNTGDICRLFEVKSGKSILRDGYNLIWQRTKEALLYKKNRIV